MDIFSPKYLADLKTRLSRPENSSSKVLVEAIRDLKGVNTAQGNEIKLLKEKLELAERENEALNQCVQALRHQHEQYRKNKELKDAKNIQTELQLRRQVQALKEEIDRLRRKQEQTTASLMAVQIKYPASNHTMAESRLQQSVGLDLSTQSDQPLQPQQLSKRIAELEEENIKLIRCIVSTSGDSIGGLRARMKENNKLISKLRTKLDSISSHN